MSRTLTALFDSHADAEQARQCLAEIGVPPADTEIMDQSATTMQAGATGDRESVWEKLKHLLMPQAERSEYEEGIRRGGSLLTASVDDSITERTVAALEGCHPIDIHERSAEWARSGWSSQPGAATTATDSSSSDDTGEEVIPVAEEQLRVGKRQVDRGAVRVRAYTIEQPVQDNVRLREEHVDVQRRPATRAASMGGGDPLEERTVEMRETGEEPVVQKETQVKEEVVIRKRAEERSQPINETVRRTKVDVEDNQGRTSGPAPASPKRDQSRQTRH
ncbi:MAG: YsnF/AvaK domain-containing protein [Steroidobacteraceae bacterium]